jgi:hypothetical protein
VSPHPLKVFLLHAEYDISPNMEFHEKHTYTIYVQREIFPLNFKNLPSFTYIMVMRSKEAEGSCTLSALPSAYTHGPEKEASGKSE